MTELVSIGVILFTAALFLGVLVYAVQSYLAQRRANRWPIQRKPTNPSREALKDIAARMEAEGRR